MKNQNNFDATKAEALWIFPPQDGTHTSFGIKHRYAEACFTKKGASAHQAHRNNFEGHQVQTWRVSIPSPVHFIRSADGKAPLQQKAERKDAPRKTWVVIDLSNGSLDTPEGHAYVFLFETRNAARGYVKVMKLFRASDNTMIKLSQPICFVQP